MEAGIKLERLDLSRACEGGDIEILDLDGLGREVERLFQGLEELYVKLAGTIEHAFMSSRLVGLVRGATGMRRI